MADDDEATGGAGGLPEGLPEELLALLQQLGGSEILGQIQQAMARSDGPVNWDLALQVALRVAAPDDRSATPEERAVADDAHTLAEHWLDLGSLPAAADAGQLVVSSRQEWVNAALRGLRPLIEPVAAASVAALGRLAAEQLGEIGGAGEMADALGEDLSAFGALLEPVGAVLMGLQTGQVVGQLSRQMLGQFDLGVPTADRSTAYRLEVNVAEAFDGYGLDPMELAIVLALHEGAHRRQYHAVPWLAGHVHSLVAAFAQGLRIDVEQVMEVSRELMDDLDVDDPASLQQALERAASVRLQPTPEQRRVLERIQGVVLLLQAWARREVREAAGERLPNLDHIEEVLRRRRRASSEGERLLGSLLGLDLKPEDERSGDAFVEAVVEARGLEGLTRALAHPENLPDAEEIAEPSRWLVRMAGGEDIPDDPSALFGAGDAPIEPPGDERRPGN